MRKVILIMACFSFLKAMAQDQKDYDHVMNKFIQFYNAEQADSICSLFADSWGEMRATLWTKEHILENKKEYGEMSSIIYVGVEPGNARLYKTVCAKKTLEQELFLIVQEKC